MVSEMGDSMYSLVEKILYGVFFIAVGGTVALIFFFAFAPSILGCRLIHKQLEALQQQTERMTEQLKRIAEYLKQEKQGGQK